MNTHPKTRALFAVTVALLLSSTVARAQLGGIHDQGAFFSDAARADASRQITEIGSRFRKDLVIETFATVPEGIKAGVNLQDRLAVNRMFEEWTIRQARQRRVNGIYILLSKDPAHLQVVVGNETQATLFSLKDRDALVGSMLTRLRAKQNDAALLQGVSFVAATMKTQATMRNREPEQARATAPAPADAPNPWGWVIAALLGFGAAWLVVGIVRALFRSGSAAGGVGAAPGAGGGFLTSLLGGMFGAAAGMWLYDQFSGHHNSDFDRGTQDDSSSSRRDTDYSSSGDSFDSDSGGDAGGGDAGGGDSGGGGGDF